MNTYKQNTPKIIETVRKAAEIARQHYNYLEYVNGRILNYSQSYLNNRNFDGLYKDISKTDKKLARQIKELIVDRNSVVEGIQITREQIFSEKLQNLENFTIMLFGRTMSGKSTTIQTFLGKDLNIVGNGTPDWTKDIEVHEWNGVRLVDTPGIEGFDESNFYIADNYMEQADLVLMVISDDHIEPSLIEKLAELLKENKPFAVLLNIKAGNPKIVFKRPEKVIRDDEVEGHIQRIKKYLKTEFEHFQSSQSVMQIPIFPVFLEGAFRAQIFLKNDEISVEDRKQYEKIYECSRFDSVIKYVCSTILENAPVIKTRSAYDSFVFRLEEVEDLLRSKVFPLKAQTEMLSKRRPTIVKDIQKIKEKMLLDFEIVKEAFDERIFGIDALLEKYVSEGAKGNLHTKYEKYLKWEDINRIELEYKEDAIKNINTYLLAFEEDMGFDLSIVAQNARKNIDYEANINLEKLSSAKLKKTTAKIIKTAGRTVAGTAPTALMGWAVANFWNPSGWAAFAAGAGVLVVGGLLGYLGSEGVKNLGNNLENSGDKDIQDEKNIIIKEFKSDLNKNYQNLKKNNDKWVNDVIDSTKKKLLDGLDLSLKESNIYINETFKFINLLTETRSEVLKKELEYIFSNILSEKDRALFSVYRVVRKVGRRLKIAIIPFHNINEDIVKIAVGFGGKNIKKLRQNFGQDIINIVGYEDINGRWGAKQVIETLGVKTIELDRVRIEDKNSRRFVYIGGCTEKELKQLYGRNKTNHNLSESLLNCKIIFEEER